MRARSAALALLLVGCSLGNPARDDCRSAAQCRRLFGAGFTCASSGLCESALDETCPELFPADIASDTDAILFGTIFNRASETQRARERAAQLAVDGINQRGGIDGRRVALLHCDASPAADAADYLVEELGVPAVIGPSSSSETETVFTTHAGAGALFISPAATATQLTDIDPSEPGRLWRTAPPDNLQAIVLLDAMAALPATRFAVITKQNDTYAQSLGLLLSDNATAAGLTETSRVQFADADGVAQAAADALTGGPPDVVVFISFRLADAARFMDEVAGLSAYDGVTLFFSDAAANDELLSLTATTPGAARYPQLRLTRPSTPDTAVTTEFVASYRAAFDGEDPLASSFTAHTYDATAMVILGAGAAGAGAEVTGDAIAAGLARMSGGPSARQLVSASFIAAIEDLRGGADLDVVGASGELDYDPVTEELSRATYDVLDVEGAGPSASLRLLRAVQAPP